MTLNMYELLKTLMCLYKVHGGNVTLNIYELLETLMY